MIISIIISTLGGSSSSIQRDFKKWMDKAVTLPDTNPRDVKNALYWDLDSTRLTGNPEGVEL
eukprot:1659782-Amphidinium_carterae.3